jgi:hypothetical protein
MDSTLPLKTWPQHFLKHEVVVDGRHAPDRGFDRTALDGALSELLGGPRLRARS